MNANMLKKIQQDKKTKAYKMLQKSLQEMPPPPESPNHQFERLMTRLRRFIIDNISYYDFKLKELQYNACTSLYEARFEFNFPEFNCHRNRHKVLWIQGEKFTYDKDPEQLIAKCYQAHFECNKLDQAMTDHLKRLKLTFS